jgi:hypothetical protein
MRWPWDARLHEYLSRVTLNMVKKLSKLVIFFSLSFAVLFLAATGLRYLAIRIDWLRSLPRQPEAALSGLIAAAHWALSLALYGSMLLSLSYAVRERVFAPAVALFLIALPLAVSFGISAALEHWEQVPPALDTEEVLGGPGLILANGQRSSDTAIILLAGPGNPQGPRVTAIPGQPLLYQADPAGPNQTVLPLPPIPFRDDTPWFLKSLAIDLRLNSEQLKQHYHEGFFSFLIYTGALIVLLSSLSCILKLSAWPLANLFLGCFAFRGVLALETFLNSPEIQDVFEAFLENRLPVSLSVPLIFCVTGGLVYIYSVLVYLAKRRTDED